MEAKHPGIHLREILDTRGWTQTDLSFILGASLKKVNLIVAGKSGISPDMSKALGEALGFPPDYFADLQKSYSLALANEPHPSIGLRARLLNSYPIREMMRRNWIKKGDAKDLERQLANFFEVGDPSQIPYLVHAPKKTNYEKKEIPPEQLAWLFRVKQIANCITAPPFSRHTLQTATKKMRSWLIAPEEARHIPRILFECGVRFIIVERLPKSKIDGVCFWLNKNAPVIGMSTRFDRIDNFWFVLRHEIEHVLRGHGQSSSEEIIDSNLDESSGGIDENLPEEERLANLAAADFCVESQKIESFLRRKYPFYYEKDVLAFSEINGVHPGIVVGQIQRHLKRYNYLKNYQVRVRQFVLPGAMADGWGQSVPLNHGASTDGR